MLKVRSYKPDVAIIDIRMPPTQTDEGLQAAKQIRETHPETAVVVLTNHIEAGYALELLQDNAEGVGYLLKDRVSDIAEFAAAVKRVAEGEPLSTRRSSPSFSDAADETILSPL